MAPPSKRFEPIQRIAKDRERKAASVLGEALKVRQAAEQRLAELRSYHAEYLERFRSATAAGSSAAQIRGYQRFLDQLEGAIREQERIAGQARQKCERSKEQWRDRYSRSKAMDGVVERLRDGERKEADKKEQSELDERNQRRR
jgi:flagellar FliJ protein